MTCHDIGWVLGAYVRFGSLNFIITNEGELAKVVAPQPLPPSASTPS
jgi:hypothetical protein